MRIAVMVLQERELLLGRLAAMPRFLEDLKPTANAN